MMMQLGDSTGVLRTNEKRLIQVPLERRGRIWPRVPQSLRSHLTRISPMLRLLEHLGPRRADDSNRTPEEAADELLRRRRTGRRRRASGGHGG
jgi:hypothetical protein